MLAFPCNQFGNQEPGSNDEIREFATETYGVTFPLFAKTEVNGDGAAPLYAWLREQQPGQGDSADIAWNFTKFLIDRNGAAVARYEPQVTPEEITSDLATYL